MDPTNLGRKGGLHGSGGHDSDFDVRRHAFRPPKFRKSQKRCAEQEEEAQNYEDDDNAGSPNDARNNTNLSPSETQQKTSDKAEERISARIDHLAKYIFVCTV